MADHECTVFETELMGIDGVPKPEKIETEAIPEAPESTEGVGEKVANIAGGAAEAVKTMLADTDQMQAHEEL